ncbi:MAG: LysR family transcriptional regulator [Pseudomonadota bacterium]
MKPYKTDRDIGSPVGPVVRRAPRSMKSALKDHREAPELTSEFNLKALRVFLTVEECGSMATAASRLRSSSSGISQQISGLERSVGGPLFDRSVRPMVLTPTGHLLKKHASHILDAVSTARSELMAMELLKPNRLRMGVIDDLDATVTPALAGQVSERYPGCIFSAYSGRSDAMTSMLAERKIDMAITADPPRDVDVYEVIPLVTEPFMLVCARGAIDPDADVKAQLMKLPFVHFDSELPLGRLVNQHLRRLKISPKTRYTFDSTRSLLAVTRDIGGWALGTPLCMMDSIRFRQSLDVLELPFSGFTRTASLVARRGEFADLPHRLAAVCCRLIRVHLLPEIVDLAPFAAKQFILHAEQEDETGVLPRAIRPEEVRS